jgi:hypothetical protein
MHNVYRGIALALVVVFLASVARFYHPDTGFTALIAFPEGHDYEAPALRDVPHFQFPAWASYDGQFYAQRALDPLVRDPQVDRAMDLAPYRARRILFSWTAYAFGLGRPAWVLEAFALQNVASWLVLAVLLTRWLPLRSPRALALWTACMFSHGLLWSVRFALLDGPSLVLTALAILASESNRPMVSAAIVGINGLGRETNVLGVLALLGRARSAPEPIEGAPLGRARAAPEPAEGARVWPLSVRDWLRLGAVLVIVALPILLWEDYLRSIYRSTIFAGGDQLAVPGSAFLSTARRVVAATRSAGLFSATGLQFGIVLTLTVQALYLVARRSYDVPWWRVAAGYALLSLVMDRVLWEPTTGAITRVMLPMTVGFNVLLARESRGLPFWTWFVAGNLHVLSSFRVMPLV